MQNLKKFDKNFKEPITSAESIDEAKTILKNNCDYVEEKLKVLPFPCFEICCVMQNSFRQLQFIAGKSFILER
jgi:hypothetical protein